MGELMRLWRWFFARRAAWTLHHPATDGKIRFSLYGNPMPEDIRRGHEYASRFLAEHEGWVLVSSPKE